MKHTMKRMMQRLSALALALCLSLSLAGAALAAGTEYVPQRPNESIGGQSCVYIDGYITYCIDTHAQWPLDPFTGAAYTNFTYGEAPEWNETTVLRMTRVLEAGFPMDAYGLSGLAPERTDTQRALDTQNLVWDIVMDDVGEGYNAYSQALSKYVLTGELPEGHTDRVDAVLVTPSVETVELSSNSVSLADDTYGAARVVLSDDTYTGSLSFDANKETGIRIISIPEGLRATRSVVDNKGETKTEALEAGSFIRTCDVLSFEADGAVDGDMTFSYTSYEVILGDSFRVFEPTVKNYQRMIGYAKDGREVEFSVSFSLPDDSQPELPPVEPTDPPVEPSIPPVEPTDPPVEPTDPPVEPTDPPVEPSDPPVEPSIPPVEPTNPPVEPTDPPVEPSEPPVEPTDPPVEPSIPPVEPSTPPTETPDEPETPSVPDDQPGDEVEIPDEDVPMGDLPEMVDEAVVEIEDEEVPLAPAPQEPPVTEEVVIMDEDVPLGNLPQTGTTAQPQQASARMMASAALFAAAALFGAAALVLSIKKREL